MLDKLQDKALQYLSAFEELAKQYTPDVLDMALKVVQINGLQTLIIYFTWFIVGVSLILYILINGWSLRRETDYFTVVMPGIVGTGCLIVSSVGILNLWNWIAIFEPKLYIAYKIFEKVLN